MYILKKGNSWQVWELAPDGYVDEYFPKILNGDGTPIPKSKPVHCYPYKICAILFTWRGWKNTSPTPNSEPNKVV